MTDLEKRFDHAMNDYALKRPEGMIKSFAVPQGHDTGIASRLQISNLKIHVEKFVQKGKNRWETTIANS